MNSPGAPRFSRKLLMGAAAIAVIVIALAAYSTYTATSPSVETSGAAQQSSDDGGMMAHAALSLIFVFGLIAVLTIAMRRLNSRNGRGKNAGHLQIISSVLIGQKKQIVLLRVMDRVLVLGVTDAAINKLAEISSSEAIEQNLDGAANSGIDFMSLLDGWRK